jgi:hypothetical protein
MDICEKSLKKEIFQIFRQQLIAVFVAIDLHDSLFAAVLDNQSSKLLALHATRVQALRVFFYVEG